MQYATQLELQKNMLNIYALTHHYHKFKFYINEVTDFW